jgi:hypothetical protein
MMTTKRRKKAKKAKKATKAERLLAAKRFQRWCQQRLRDLRTPTVEEIVTARREALSIRLAAHCERVFQLRWRDTTDGLMTALPSLERLALSNLVYHALKRAA